MNDFVMRYGIINKIFIYIYLFGYNFIFNVVNVYLVL